MHILIFSKLISAGSCSKIYLFSVHYIMDSTWQVYVIRAQRSWIWKCLRAFLGAYTTGEGQSLPWFQQQQLRLCCHGGRVMACIPVTLRRSSIIALA